MGRWIVLSVLVLCVIVVSTSRVSLAAVLKIADDLFAPLTVDCRCSLSIPSEEGRSGVLPERIVIHAGGAVNGMTYTNSREALDLHYRAGCRVFELDFIWTADDHLVLLHDWHKTAIQVFGRHLSGQPMTHQEFLLGPRVDGLSSLDAGALGRWLREHPVAAVVTDIKAQNLKGLALLRSLPGVGYRFIPQIYSFDEYEAARGMGFDRIILTLYLANVSDDAVVEFARHHPLFAVTMPVDRALGSLPRRLAEIGVPTYAHTVNGRFQWALLQRRGVYGIYTDRKPGPNLGQCGVLPDPAEG